MSIRVLALPASRHVPGSGSVPDRAHLEAAKRAFPARTRRLGCDDADYRYGSALANAGYYCEAHERWEAAWLRAAPNSRERALLKALVEIVNAELKVEMRRPSAAQLLLSEARGILSGLDPRQPVLGVDLVRLLELIEGHGWVLAVGTPHGRMPLPLADALLALQVP